MTDQDLMQLAIAEARAAEDAGEVPIGAVIAYKNEIIARGQNRVLRDHDPHASGLHRQLGLGRPGWTGVEGDHRVGHRAAHEEGQADRDGEGRPGLLAALKAVQPHDPHAAGPVLGIAGAQVLESGPVVVGKSHERIDASGALTDTDTQLNCYAASALAMMGQGDVAIFKLLEESLRSNDA